MVRLPPLYSSFAFLYVCFCVQIIFHCAVQKAFTQVCCTDPRNVSTVPLNFTKSINLALSERGINAMRHAQREDLLDSILKESIPMYGRMIHGRNIQGDLYQASQVYDIHGRVSCPFLCSMSILMLTGNPRRGSMGAQQEAFRRFG